MRVLLLAIALAACAPALPAPPEAPPAAAIAPPPRPSGGAAPESIVPVTGAEPEALDTTTQAEREAAAGPAEGGAALGVVVASLGNPAEPGFWLETPLVSAVGPGRVELKAGGQSVAVELRPASGGGSRLSLAAMRLLGVALTDLPELEVFSG